MKNIILHSILFSLAFLNITSLLAQDRDMVKEHQYEAQLAAIDPSSVEIFKTATIEFDKENYALADSLYKIVYAHAPAFTPAIRRLGGTELQLGNIDGGIALCEKAVELEKSYANVITLVTTLIRSGGQSEYAPTTNLDRARDLLVEARTLPEADEFECTALNAQIALSVSQGVAFSNETKILMSKYPDKMVSHYYAAIDAAQNEEWRTAESEILIAQKMGLSDESVNSFLDSGVGSKARMWRYSIYFLWVLCIWIAGFGLLYGLGMFLSWYTLTSIEKEFQTNSVTELSKILKRIYKFLISIAGAYYYISLPIVLVIVIGLVAAAFYLFLMIGRIPIQLMFILAGGACYTVYGMIRSLLLKVNYADPGRELKQSDAPGLFALTKEVADTMGTRPIDEIRITPEADLAVYERGSWKEKMQDKGKRILILGTGVLKDFKKNDFRAILAHEYGHFTNRDTAGGAVALRVQNDIHKYFYALYAAGQAVGWNMAFQFLRLYSFIFRRISNGATRLQEILADRVAAQTYGAQSFQNGLTYVVKRNIEFVKLAHIEIEEAKKIKRSFNNIYELTGNPNDGIEEEFQKSLNRKTTEDDTHPSPVDRFRLVKGLGAGKDRDNTAYVRDLFTDWNGLTQEMTKKIEDSWIKPEVQPAN